MCNKAVLAAVLAFCASALCDAQNSPQFRACDAKAKTQLQLNRCASDEAARVDAELAEVHRKVRDRASHEAGAVAKIEAAHRAWIVYRDAYIDAMYPAQDKQAEYGSMYPMEVDLLRAAVARKQVGALSDLLKEYTERASAVRRGRMVNEPRTPKPFLP